MNDATVADAIAYAKAAWERLRPRPLPVDSKSRYAQARFVDVLGSDESVHYQRDYDASATAAATLLRAGKPLGPWLTSFAADVLTGERKRPAHRGPDGANVAARDRILALLVRDVADRFNLPLFSHNEFFDGATAAQIVALAARVKPETVVSAIRKFGGKVSA